MPLRPRHALWLVIAALHLLLLTLLTSRQRPQSHPERNAIPLQLLSPQPRQPATRTAQPTEHWRPPRDLRPGRVAPDARSTPLSEVPEPPTPGVQPLPAPAPSPPRLIESEATRHAIRITAASPFLSERAAAATGIAARENAEQRFAREVASSAPGNCLKGEFPGGGMELLSLPFWIAAEASGKCRK
jgi:hypothetical protein